MRPEGYDGTYKRYTRRGSRVHALGSKEMDIMNNDKVSHTEYYSALWFVHRC